MVFGGGGGDRKAGSDRDRSGRQEARDETGFLSELIKRAVDKSVQAVLHGDEATKSLVDAVLPRELLGTVLQAVDGTKREAVAIVGREMREFLATLNVSDEIRKILTSVSFEIRTEVRFVPNEDGGLRSEVSATARPKRTAARRKRARAKETGSSSVRGAAARSRAAAVAAGEATRDTVRRVVDKLAEKTVEMASDERRRSRDAAPQAESPRASAPSTGPSAENTKL